VQAVFQGHHTRLFDFGLGPNAVFIADVTGDGYPDFVYMTSWTSGRFTLGVHVYDYVNDAHHTLRGYGDANGLTIVNGRLMVTQSNADGTELSPVGELIMVNGELAIAGLDRQDDFLLSQH
jgi:hypothetical protein